MGIELRENLNENYTRKSSQKDCTITILCWWQNCIEALLLLDIFPLGCEKLRIYSAENFNKNHSVVVPSAYNGSRMSHHGSIVFP